jgi:hypothetical protein
MTTLSRSSRAWLSPARVMRPSLSYCYFNMDDSVVGGYTPERIALRHRVANQSGKA